ncbi:hypothetical protein ACNKHR_25100 [Shigella flexneri]
MRGIQALFVCRDEVGEAEWVDSITRRGRWTMMRRNRIRPGTWDPLPRWRYYRMAVSLMSSTPRLSFMVILPVT